MVKVKERQSQNRFCRKVEGKHGYLRSHRRIHPAGAGRGRRFNCVPSQINYVMSTRFSPEHGYIVESRRGGGGYIRITRVQVDRQTLLMHVINTIGDTLDYASARAITQNLVDSEAISRELGQSMLAATGERALRSVPKEQRSGLRADIFKQILIHSV